MFKMPGQAKKKTEKKNGSIIIKRNFFRLADFVCGKGMHNKATLCGIKW